MAGVAFVVHPDRPDALESAQRVGKWLEEAGHSYFVGVQHVRGADLAVCLGGDGTMLHCAVEAAPAGVPLLGVNLGRLGYLTEVDPSMLLDALRRFLEGDFVLEERMMLEVALERAGDAALAGETAHEPAQPGKAASGGGGVRTRARAAGEQGGAAAVTGLNEAALEKTLPGHTIRIALEIDSRRIITYEADGLLVATPTGSTAYNFSARGPVVSPRLHAMVVTPVSPHMLFDRPLVLHGDEVVRMELLGPRPAVLVVDGEQRAELSAGDAVVCRRAEHPALIVSLGTSDVYGVLRDRFGLVDR